MSGGKYLLFLFFLSLALPGFFPKTCLADAKRIFEDNKKSVVILFSYDKEGRQIGQATGFIVSTDGAVLTNYHFVSNAARIKIKADKTMLDVKDLLYFDRKNDIAMLKIGGKNLPAVKIRGKSIGPEGQKIFVMGSPLGEDKILFEGTLSKIKDIAPERKLLLMTVPVTKGSSGSPVFNEKGEVIGIATFFMEEAAPFYFAMPVAFIKDKLSLKKTVPLATAKLTAFENTAEYWFILGAVYDSLGMFTDASGAYQKAVELDPQDAIAHNNLGVVYTNLEIYSFAIREHNEAIMLRPASQEAYLNLGRAYVKSGMTQAAIEAFKKAIRLKPDDAKAQHNLAMALLNAGKSKEAIEAFKQAIHIKPDYAEAYYNLGIAHYQMNMNQDAMQAFAQAIQINPDFPKVHFWLGVIYSAQDTASALKEYEILKKLDQSDAMVLHKIIEVKGNIASNPSGSAPAGTAAPQKESHILTASGPPGKAPGPPGKLAGQMDISKKEPPGKSRRPSQKDMYSVQVSFSNNKMNAEALVKRLKKKGYNVFLKKEDEGERYRVLVGKFKEKDKAAKQAMIILKKEKIKPIIFKHKKTD